MFELTPVSRLLLFRSEAVAERAPEEPEPRIEPAKDATTAMPQAPSEGRESSFLPIVRPLPLGRGRVGKVVRVGSW